MKTKFITVTILASSLALGGCNLLTKSNKSTVTATTQPTTNITTMTPQKAAITLAGQWSVIDVGGTAVTVSGDEERPYVGFDTADVAPGTVNFYANNGCNFINGTFGINGNKLTKKGDYISTMKYCADAKYEIPITTALDATTAFSIEKLNNEYFLYLKDNAGATLMTLRKHNLNFLNGAWKVTQIQGVDLKSTAETQIVIDLSELKIHGNAGCNVLNGSVELNMDRENGIGFTNMYTTRMTCPDIAIEQSFLLALEQVESCVPGPDNDTAYMRDAAGKTIIVMKRMELKQE